MNAAQELLDKRFGKGVYRAVKQAELLRVEDTYDRPYLRIGVIIDGDSKELSRYTTTANPEVLIREALEDLAYAEGLKQYWESEGRRVRAKVFRELFGEREENSLTEDEKVVFEKYLALYLKNKELKAERK